MAAGLKRPVLGHSSPAGRVVGWLARPERPVLRRSGPAEVSADAPAQKSITAVPTVDKLDIFFLVETTWNAVLRIDDFGPYIPEVVMPGLSGVLGDIQWGLGGFQDFPVEPWGSPDCEYTGQPDQPFTLLQPLTDYDTFEPSLDLLLGPNGDPAGCGGDIRTSRHEALYQVATGEGLSGPGATDVPAYDGPGAGGVGFREDALRLVVTVSYAPTHVPSSGCGSDVLYTGEVAEAAHSYAQVVEALQANSIRVGAVDFFGGHWNDCDLSAETIQLAADVETTLPPEAYALTPGGFPSLCTPGECCMEYPGQDSRPVAHDNQCPLSTVHAPWDGVHPADWEHMADFLPLFVRYVRFDMRARVDGVAEDRFGQPLPAGTSTADFIASVAPSALGDPPLPGGPMASWDETGFQNLIPETETWWSIDFDQAAVPVGSSAGLFIASVDLETDMLTGSTHYDVWIVVPPGR